jgi:tryptophan synthase alpha chain
VTANASGFLYYVSMNGITGSAVAQVETVKPEVARIKAATDTPIVIGFGVKTPEASKALAGLADGVVVGSAIVERIGRGDEPRDVLAFVKTLADAAHSEGTK